MSPSDTVASRLFGKDRGKAIVSFLMDKRRYSHVLGGVVNILGAVGAILFMWLETPQIGTDTALLIPLASPASSP
jgi:hypothetical protein